MEIRSLNQRFLDISIKSPSMLNQHEMAFRDLVRSQFGRGKFDVTIVLEGDAAMVLNVNHEIARSVYDSLRSLQNELAIPGTIDINSMTLFREMFMETDPSYDLQAILKVFAGAVENLRLMRQREGALLVAELERLLAGLDAMNSDMKVLSAQSAPNGAARLQERLANLMGSQEIDPARLHQEVAILAGKLDITEEIARLDCHISQFREILAGDGIIGRKLDFLVQELNREVNTISSKSVDYGIVQLAVNMKTEIEKIKEQVQNLQ